MCVCEEHWVSPEVTFIISLPFNVLLVSGLSLRMKHYVSRSSYQRKAYKRV